MAESPRRRDHPHPVSCLDLPSLCHTKTSPRSFQEVQETGELCSFGPPQT